MKEEKDWREIVKLAYSNSYDGILQPETIKASTDWLIALIESKVLPQEISKAKQETRDKEIALIDTIKTNDGGAWREALNGFKKIIEAALQEAKEKDI